MNDNEKIKDSEQGVKIEAEQVSKQEEPTLKQELETCKVSVNEWKNKCVRAAADFENFKKRMIQDQKLWLGTAQAEILGDVLTIVDDFERALAEQKKRELSKEVVVWLEGFDMTYQSLQKLLKKFGVEEIMEHDTFNPIYHEAMMQVDSSEHESGAVVEVTQKGYRFKGKVLRPAKVSVAK